MLAQAAVCSNLRDHQSAIQVFAAAGRSMVDKRAAGPSAGGRYAYGWWWWSPAEPAWGPGYGVTDLSLLCDGLDVTEPNTALIGRERDCGRIERLIRNARNGEGGCLVLLGEPGIGKTALLEHAAQVAGAVTTVLRAGGVEAESDLAFAGLHSLLRPILGKLDQLAGPQRQALAGALGLAPSSRPDRLFVSAAVLGLIVAAAEDRPVLCLVDDAQWIDSPSAGALVFTARRLRAERVAIVFAAREGEPRQFQAQDLPEMSLDSLPEAAAGQLLDCAAPAIAPAVRNRLLADEAQSRGTVNHTPVYPREVAKRALELNATALILVHNHPSGDPTPSAEDVAMTRQIHAAVQAVSVVLHDHVIVGNGRHTSFREVGLL